MASMFVKAGEGNTSTQASASHKDSISGSGKAAADRVAAKLAQLKKAKEVER